MAIMVGVVGALSAFYHDNHDIHDAGQRLIRLALRLNRQNPQRLQPWRSNRTLSGSRSYIPETTSAMRSYFLYMMFSVPAENYSVDPVLARAIDDIFILHADHEQNASTSTVRLAGSSGANPFACIAAGIACLWGPAHGGANEAVLTMLEEIGTADRIPEFVARAKRQGRPVPPAWGSATACTRTLIPGPLSFGPGPMTSVEHPWDAQRAASCSSPSNSNALRWSDEYFVERKLYPNVDFYSGIDRCERWAFPQASSLSCSLSHERWDGAAQWADDDGRSVPKNRSPASTLHADRLQAGVCPHRPALAPRV